MPYFSRFLMREMGLENTLNSQIPSKIAISRWLPMITLDYFALDIAFEIVWIASFRVLLLYK